MLSQSDRGYAAGLIDGEGCISIHSVRNYSRRRKAHVLLHGMRVWLCNTNYDLVRWMADRFGGAVQLRKKEPSAKPIWVWGISGKVALRCLIQIKPYLVGKRLQAELACQFQSTIQPDSHKTKSLSESVILHRERLKNRMHVLNRKGVSHGVHLP